MNAHNPIKTHVKERAEEQSSAMTQDQQAAIRMLANDLHRLNQAVMKAVEAGVSVELVRSARPGQGNADTDKHVSWGPGPRASQALTLCARAVLPFPATTACADLTIFFLRASRAWP